MRARRMQKRKQAKERGRLMDENKAILRCLVQTPYISFLLVFIIHLVLTHLGALDGGTESGFALAISLSISIYWAVVQFIMQLLVGIPLYYFMKKHNVKSWQSFAITGSGVGLTVLVGVYLASWSIIQDPPPIWKPIVQDTFTTIYLSMAFAMSGLICAVVGWREVIWRRGICSS